MTTNNACASVTKDPVALDEDDLVEERMQKLIHSAGENHQKEECGRLNKQHAREHQDDLGNYCFHSLHISRDMQREFTIDEWLFIDKKRTNKMVKTLRNKLLTYFSFALLCSIFFTFLLSNSLLLYSGTLSILSYLIIVVLGLSVFMSVLWVNIFIDQEINNISILKILQYFDWRDHWLAHHGFEVDDPTKLGFSLSWIWKGLASRARSIREKVRLMCALTFRPRFKKKYVADKDGSKEIREKLERDLRVLECTRGTTQLETLNRQVRTLAELLGEKFSEEELTYGRYYRAVKGVYLSAIDSLCEIASIEKAMSAMSAERTHSDEYSTPTDTPAPLEDIKRLAREEKRLSLGKKRARIEELLRQNDGAIQELAHHAQKISELPQRVRLTRVSAEVAQKELGDMSARMEQYAQVR
jgi:hypothetical protein